jgi:LysR family transcriptional regulator, regulator for bpeEF and oprC
MLDLNTISDFIAIVQAGSFAGAARTSGTPKSTLSKRIATLESDLGTRLIERSTRSLRLTAEGIAFHQHALAIKAEVDAAQDFLAAQRSEPHGVLRISAPVLFGQFFLGSISAHYIRRHPLARLDIVLSDRRVDMLQENFEASIRIGEQPDSNLIAKTFAHVDHVLVCAGDIPMPQNIEEITSFPCIVHIVETNMRAKWALVSETLSVNVEVSPKIAVSSMFAVREAAKSGAGLAFLPRFLVHDDLIKGRLVQPFPDWHSKQAPVSITYPSSRFVSPRLGAFIALLQEQFQGRSLDFGSENPYQIDQAVFP